jgi:hypothetical protein
LGKGNSSFFKQRGITILQGEIITKSRNTLKIFKKIFSRTSRPNSIKLNTNYPWVKGIQVYLDKGPDPLQRGDNNKNVKIGWGYLKILFSRTTGPSLARLGTNHPWVEGILVNSNEEDSPSPMGNNSKRVKMHRKNSKVFSRTSRRRSIKLGTNYPSSWMKGFQVVFFFFK